MNGVIGGITAAVVASLLGEVFLADGEMKKYVRSGITCIVILILLITFLGVTSENFNEFDFFDENVTIYDSIELSKSLTISKIELINQGLEKENRDIRIDEYDFNDENKLVLVHISTKRESISDNEDDILDIEELKAAIAGFLDISQDVVKADMEE